MERWYTKPDKLNDGISERQVGFYKRSISCQTDIPYVDHLPNLDPLVSYFMECNGLLTIENDQLRHDKQVLRNGMNNLNDLLLDRQDEINALNNEIDILEGRVTVELERRFAARRRLEIVCERIRNLSISENRRVIPVSLLPVLLGIRFTEHINEVDLHAYERIPETDSEGHNTTDTEEEQENNIVNEL